MNERYPLIFDTSVTLNFKCERGEVLISQSSRSYFEAAKSLIDTLEFSSQIKHVNV